MAVCSRFQGPENIVTVLLIGMALRMGIPLAAAIIARIFGGPLANSFFLNYLIVFYPVTLAAETWLSLPQGRKNDSSAEDFAR